MNKKTVSLVKGCAIIPMIYLYFALFLPSTAFAYVDPGSGGIIVTTILGFIAAIGYTFRKYFYKIKRLLTKKQDAADDGH